MYRFRTCNSIHGSYCLDPVSLKGQNPLDHSGFRASWEKPKPRILHSQGTSVFFKHLLHRDRGLKLILTALQVFGEYGRENEKILKRVSNAVCNGIPVMSHFFSKGQASWDCFQVFRSENPISIFTSVNCIFKTTLLDSGKSEMIRNKRRWIGAVCEGHNRRKEEICNELVACGWDEFEMKIPDLIASLIFSFISEEALIKQAKKKFDEEEHNKNLRLWDTTRRRR